ncbi:hypothetical protein EfmAA610_12040 [Enterococcus faecium]|nr:hypothetical protein EfmAA610_12040 [Enterococcus faecium]
MTSHPLAESIKAFNGSDGFYFYDAAAPIVDKATIDVFKFVSYFPCRFLTFLVQKPPEIYFGS